MRTPLSQQIVGDDPGRWARTRKMLFRNACMLFDSTGYCLAFGMNELQGRKMCRTGSACHRPRLR